MEFDVNFINQMWKYNTNGWQRTWPVVKWTLYIIFIWAQKTPISTISTLFALLLANKRITKAPTDRGCCVNSENLFQFGIEIDHTSRVLTRREEFYKISLLKDPQRGYKLLPVDFN